MNNAGSVVTEPRATGAARLNSLRKILKLVIGNTEYELASVRGGVRMNSGERRAVGDVTDDIIREVDLAVTAARANTLTQRLLAASDALRRLEAENGSYGVCEDCEEPISETRLNALPFATRCVACQERSECIGPLTRRQTGARFTP